MSLIQHLQNNRIVLDGALGTQLEENIPRDSPLLVKGLPLWSTKVLIQEPQLITNIHASYLAQGAQMVITSSYQASKQTLEKHEGMSLAQAQKVWNSSIECVKLAIETAKPAQKIFVAASIGPYGAYLANGAEYLGEYGDLSVYLLADYHRDMVQYFAQLEADCIAFETIPNFLELQAVFELAKTELLGSPKEFYVTLSCRDLSTLADGTPIKKVVEYITEELGNEKLNKIFIGTGCNCVPYEIVSDFVANVNSTTSQLGVSPLNLIVYPNYGFENDMSDVSQYVFKKASEKWAQAVEHWCSFANVKVIGGCCSTGPEEIGQINRIVTQHGALNMNT